MTIRLDDALPRVYIEGVEAWCEFDSSDGNAIKACPNCRRRKFDDERKHGFSRHCLRCHRATNDPEDWSIPGPLSRLASQASREEAKRESKRKACEAEKHAKLLGQIKAYKAATKAAKRKAKSKRQANKDLKRKRLAAKQTGKSECPKSRRSSKPTGKT
jgi:hypothetical protein